MNKRIILFCFAFCILIGLLSGCGDIEIKGIENFSENSCDKGLNNGLLSGNHNFLVNYPYQDAEYQYWTDGSYQQYKTFVCLRYAKEVYENAKVVCQTA